MHLTKSTHYQNFIPSFQTIDFRLTSRNLSQYPSLCDYNNVYQAGSLTYTQSEVDNLNSMKFLEQAVISINNFSQSFMNIDIDLVNKPQKVWNQEPQEYIRNPQNMQKPLQQKENKQIENKNVQEQYKQKLFGNCNKIFGNENKVTINRKKTQQNHKNNIKIMNKKKSILMINNLQLNFLDNHINDIKYNSNNYNTNNYNNTNNYSNNYNNNNYNNNYKSINNNRSHRHNQSSRNSSIEKKKLFQNNNKNIQENNQNNQKQSILTGSTTIHVKSNISSGKLSILSRSRKTSISSQSTATHNLFSPPTTQQSIGSSIVMGYPYSSHKTQPNHPSQIGSSLLIKKRCFSDLRRPKSSRPSSSSQASSLCCIFKKQNYQSLIKCLQKKASDPSNLSQLSIDTHMNEKVEKSKTKQMDKKKEQKKQQKMKNIRRKNFLQDPVPLDQIMNVKQIKLEENSHVQKNYLRKIIQNRVSINHLSEHEKQRQI